ncbi:unnamed protein product [Schistosoma margrebowiei]|uniref:L-lactate dehydrogenase n=1 Tax=Schistosoma margrebowiei TaxID=48269 RepID=A0A183L8G9_9TREM|nr:unnamed protein product [Schistosoma margrebowiei]VDO31952.1 unnamed protein product [Schistosoma margrebowiei]
MTSLLWPVASDEVEYKNRSKISVVGCGAVGTSIAFSLLDMAGEIALIDVNEFKVKGEVMDLMQGQLFSGYCKITGGSDLKLTTNSDIIVVTACGTDKNENPEQQLVKNVKLYQEIIPKIIYHSPQCVLLIVTNPVDIMTHVAAKLSGFPKHRVFGTGTILDSARFRYLLGQKFSVDASSVHGYIIGELGENSIPLWSTVNIAGARLVTKNAHIRCSSDPENCKLVYESAIKSTEELNRLKGCNSWSIGLACRAICDAIIHNLHVIYPVSVYVKDVNGIQEDAFLSFPSLINSKGISHIIPQQLNPDEERKINQSVQKQIIMVRHLGI